MLPQDQILSVLLVDDSAVMRRLFSELLERHPQIKVNATAMNGRFALEKLKMHSVETFDFILLDLEMPEMNGVEFLKEKKNAGFPQPCVVISALSRGDKLTFEALAAGAVDFVEKPRIGQTLETLQDRLIQLVFSIGLQYRLRAGRPLRVQADALRKITDVSAWPGKSDEQSKAVLQKPLRSARPQVPLRVMAIGISTGGPSALRVFFHALPKSVHVPIVLVQHMPEGFTEEFAKSLDKITHYNVVEAHEGQDIQEGYVYLAPAGRHMKVLPGLLNKNTIHIFDAPLHNSHRPSVGILFESVAEVYGNSSLALIMTGMGHDGSEEINQIFRSGGLTVGQDESSSVVYGMPRISREKGYLDYVVSLEEMAPFIAYLVEQSKNVKKE